MAQNDNVVFKTSTTATINDLFNWNKSTGQITAKTDSIPIVPGTVYFTADGHIVHDLTQNNRLWMSKNAYSAIYAKDISETNTDIANAIKYSIHYVEGPTTDTTPGTWTGTINGITELYDGLTIIYVPAVAGKSPTTTLNINGLGAKTCYYSNTSAITTHYSVGTPILLTYRNNCWRRADYNSNTTYSAMSVAEMRAGTATSERSIRADYLKTFLSTLGGTNLTLTHSNSAPYLQLNHDPSGITAGTYGNNSQQNPSYGGTFNIPYFTVDTQGHITNASVTTVKIPESDNTDYKVRQTPINSNDNNNYRILLSNSANDTSEDSVSKKNANLIYNPTENKLSTGNIKLTGELDVTGNVYLRNQTAVDSLTAGSLIVNGNSTFNNDINLAQGAVKWTSNSLPSVTSANYFLVIDAFANGGATKYITKADAIKTLISSSAIGSSTKPVYWTGSAFNAITSYSGAAALTGTPTAPTATAGTSTTQIATTEFVTNAVAQGFIANDAMVFKGLIGSNQPITQLPTSGYNAGWTYRVANAGIFAGEYCEVGDLLIAIKDGPTSGSSVINTDWGKVEHNIDGAVFRGSGASNSSVGSSTQPVYVNSSGIVTAITGAIANDITGNAATATTLTTGRTLKVNLASTSASTAFNGAANITDIGVSGILPITQGGTGQDNIDNFVKVYSRSDMGNSINYDDPGVNGLFEARKSSEITATGEWPGGMESWFPLLSLKTSSVIMQIAGKSQYGYGWWIRGGQGANATLAGIAWERLVTNSGTWDINITGTATTASKLSNNSKIGDTNKPVYFKADGTPAAINYTIATSVPSGAVFTDRYVNSAAFTDDSTNTVASPVKMTLTRAGSDTATVTANIPKVSSSSAGVVPKGTTVSSQSQSTKFLREDGTWAAPSYTVNTNTDTLVKQTAKSDNKNYKILFTTSDSPTSGNANEAAYDTNITINPNTHTLTATKFIGSLQGNADTATTAGGITSAGTTAQFWRGDNSWSNILAQTAATTLGIDTSNSKIGTAIRTLHIATNTAGSGAGVADGQAAGITFGASTAAYAGIYYQSSNAYGSRLYFATTNNFASGSYARMMITHDGKIGIGTTSPSTRLHVDGDVTITGLTASQAVATDANKKLISTNLTTSDPAASGTGISYIATISQSATGKITATKSTVQSASTSQAGILKFTADNTNAQLNTLTIGSSTPTDNDYYISQYVGGGTTTTTYHRRPVSALWNYISGKITNGIYWGNVKTTSAATYKAQPEVASIKINGKTAAGDTDSVSTKNVQLVYDASLETLNFVFS